MKWLDKFCNTHKGVRRTAVFSAIAMMWVITMATVIHATDLSATAGILFGSIITACGTLVGLYERSRARESGIGGGS